MRDGKTMCINIDKSCPDFFGKYNCADFPTDLCFDSAQWKLKENYIKIVKEEENTSIGGINPGMYFLQPLYNLILLSTCSHDALQDMHLSIPHFDKFHKIRIS